MAQPAGATRARRRRQLSPARFNGQERSSFEEHSYRRSSQRAAALTLEVGDLASRHCYMQFVHEIVIMMIIVHDDCAGLLERRRRGRQRRRCWRRHRRSFVVGGGTATLE